MKKYYYLKVLGLLSILLWSSAGAIAQQLSGIVRDAEDQQPLIGANIRIEGTSQGTVTDLDGKFTLDVSAEDVLIVSYIGYEEQRIVVGDQSYIEILLNFAVTQMSEVVVIGYGVQEKKVATGSIGSVNAEDIEGFKVASVESAIDGMVSGIQINEGSGQPGEDMNIFIRGIGTNGDNTPLYIVDGMTVHSISYLNPGDIKSINVLKDAASTAIYGARGANGVVIVSTKSGTGEDKGTFSYEFSFLNSQPWRLPEMLNSKQYSMIITEKNEYIKGVNSIKNNGFPVYYKDDTGEYYIQKNNLNEFDTVSWANSNLNGTDWFNVIMDPANTVRHSLSAAYKDSYFSMDYWDEVGAIGGESSRYKRISMRANSEKEINDYVTVRENITFVHTQNPRIGTNNTFGGMIADAFAYDPLTAVYNDTLQFGLANSKWVQKEHRHPLSHLYTSASYGHSQRLLGDVGIKITPFEGLSFNSVLGVDFDWSRYRNYSPSYSLHTDATNATNDITQGYSNWITTQFENYLSYDKTFNDHKINVVLGSTYKDVSNEWAGSTRQNIPVEVEYNENWQYVDGSSDVESDEAFGGGSVNDRLISYFGRTIYSYQGKYLFTASLRRDGSSKFGANNRFGYFPSFSGGWIISDESFFAIPQVSFLKLRGSWGVNGNDRIGSLRYAATIENNFTYAFGRVPSLFTGAAQERPANPNLKWEESQQFNIGIDLNFLGDQITTEIDYYVKNTVDLLMDEVIAGYIGSTENPASNLGSIQNRGIEFAGNYQGKYQEINYKVGLTYTFLKNEVLEVAGDATSINGATWPVKNVVISTMEEGYPIGHFVGYKTDGIFNSIDEIYSYINREGDLIQEDAEPGDLKFVDINGDGVINSEDITDLGSPWPDHFIGANFSGNYKGFDLSMVWSSQLGHQVYRIYERTDVPFQNWQTFWLDRWNDENTDTDIPRLGGNFRTPSSFYVEDASFLRLRNVQLGYNIPESIISKAQFTSVRIYLTGSNLLTFTKYRGYDPEIGTSGWILDTNIDRGYYPTNKSIGFGIKVTM